MPSATRVQHHDPKNCKQKPGDKKYEICISSVIPIADNLCHSRRAFATCQLPPGKNGLAFIVSAAGAAENLSSSVLSRPNPIRMERPSKWLQQREDQTF